MVRPQHRESLEYNDRELQHYPGGDATKQGKNHEGGLVLCRLCSSVHQPWLFSLLASKVLHKEEKAQRDSLCSPTSLRNCLKADVLRQIEK